MRFLRRLLYSHTGPGSSTSRPRARYQPRLEGLEERAVPTAGAIFHVNTTTAGDQTNADVAYSSNGKSVVVWESRVSPGNRDVFAQMYAANGSKLGRQFAIAQGASDQFNPQVTMNSRGFLAVAWEDRTAAGADKIRVRRFTGPGAAWGNIIEVANTAARESAPGIAMIDRAGASDDGAFVVSYTTGGHVQAKMYSRWAFVQKTINVGGVQADANSTEGRGVVARAANGTFMVGYVIHDPDGSTSFTGEEIPLDTVRVDRFSRTGTLLGRTSVGASPAFFGFDLAVDAQGNGRFAHMYQVQDGAGGPIADVVTAGRIDRSGRVLERRTVFSGATNLLEVAVASNKVDKGFALGFVSRAFAAGSKPRVTLVEVTAAGVRKSTDLGINHAEPSIAIGPNNKYLIAYTTTVTTAVDPGKGIFGRFGKIA